MRENRVLLSIAAASLLFVGTLSCTSELGSEDGGSLATECEKGVSPFSADLESGILKSLCDYEGEVLLIVNIAANCSLTPQLGGLTQLQNTYGSQGFHVLGFWNDQFLGLEQMGDLAQREAAKAEYSVSFPLFDPINVNPPNEHPLYTWLKAESGGNNVGWNFEKFLVARNGAVINRYLSAVEPDQIKPDIAAAL